MIVGDDLIKKLNDPNKFEIFDDVAVLDEHHITDADGKEIGYADEDLLKKIANNNNKLIEETGDACPVVIGHTKDENKLGEKPDEKDQPEVVGYATGFFVDKMPKTGKKAIFARFHIYKDRADDVERLYPRRSVELWTHGHWEINPISLLGATAPERNLGLMIRKQRSGTAIFYKRKSRYYYNPNVNQFQELKPVRIDTTNTELKREAVKMARFNDGADAYNKDHDDLTDFDPKLMNTILKVLEKTPMWQFYKDQEKMLKDEKNKAEEQEAAMSQQPPPPDMAAAQPPNSNQAPPDGGQPMGSQNQSANAPLTPEEMQELQQLLNSPSMSGVAGLQPGQGPKIPDASAPVQQSRKAKPVVKKERDDDDLGTVKKKKIIATALPASIATEADDDDEDATDMKRSGSKNKMSSHKKPPKKYAQDEDLEEEETPDFNGTTDDAYTDEDSTSPDSEDYNGEDEDGESYEDDDSTVDDAGEGDDEEKMEEWHDEDGDEDEMGEEVEMPVKKQASMPSATNCSIPAAAQKKRPSEAGSTRNPKRKEEMAVKNKASVNQKYSKVSNNKNALLNKLARLEKIVERLTAENEAIRTRERYARRENQVMSLINEGFEVDNPKELFEDFKDESDEGFEKQIKIIRKYARQNRDISRVNYFDLEEGSSLPNQREITEREAQSVGRIMAKNNCGFEEAKKIYLSQKN